MYSHVTRGNNDLYVTTVNKNCDKKVLNIKLPSFGTDYLIYYRNVHLSENLLKKSSPICSQQEPIVRANSLVYDLNNYYSVTNNSPIIQFTDNCGMSC